jgi:RNA polymerase sigma-70 factor (ECF subfamily)
LVARFQTGDVRALETLFDLYADRALGLAVRLTETREDAEEVTQEAFIRAFRHARQFRGEASSFGAWLFTIVRNLARDKRRQLRLPTLSLEATSAKDLIGGATAEEEAARRVQRRELLNALDALPEEWRVVLSLCDLEEMSHAEAAQVLGKSVSATKSLLYRARRALRDQLTLLWGTDDDL